jgi:hypothetical protein
MAAAASLMRINLRRRAFLELIWIKAPAPG